MKKGISIALILVMIATLGISLLACDPSEVTVTFETNGGSAIESVVLDVKAGLNVDDLVPTKEGFKFAGWYFDKELTEAYNKDKKVKDNFTLYAKYDELSKFTITFDSQGGTPVSPVVFREDKKPNIDPIGPTKTDYVFDGWYLDKALTNKFDINNTPKENFTLYAGWVLSNTVSVTFNTDKKFTMDQKRFVIDRNSKLAELPVVNQNNKYFFDGWYLDSEYTTALTTDYVFTNSTTVYVKATKKNSLTDFVDNFKATVNAANLKNGFNIDLSANIKFEYIESLNKSDIALGFNLKGNLLGTNNHDLGLEITDLYTHKVIAGIYEIDQVLYVRQDNEYNKLPIKADLSKMLYDYVLKFDGENFPESILKINVSSLNVPNVETIDDLLNLVPTLEGLGLIKVDYERKLVENQTNYLYNYLFNMSTQNIGSFLLGLGDLLPDAVKEIANTLNSQNITVSFVIENNNAAGVLDLANTKVVIDNTDNSGNGTLSLDTKLNIQKPVENPFNIPESAIKVATGITKQGTVQMKAEDNTVLANYGYTFKTNIPSNNVIDVNAVIEEVFALGKINFDTKDITETINNIRRVITDDKNLVNIKTFIKNMLEYENAKFYLDVTHKCDATCQLKHRGVFEGTERKDMDGSILSIAYDPENSKNKKVYISILPGAILPADYNEALSQILDKKVIDIIKSAIDGYIDSETKYMGAAVDLISMYNTIKKTTPEENVKSAVKTAQEEVLEQSKGIDGILELLAKYIMFSEGKTTINLKNIVENIKPVVGQNISNVIDIISKLFLATTAKIEINNTVTSFEPVTDNIIEMFKYQKADVLKEYNVKAQGDALSRKRITNNMALGGAISKESKDTMLESVMNTVQSNKYLNRLDLKAYNPETQETKVVLTKEEIDILCNDVRFQIAGSYVDMNGIVVPNSLFYVKEFIDFDKTPGDHVGHVVISYNDDTLSLVLQNILGLVGSGLIAGVLNIINSDVEIIDFPYTVAEPTAQDSVKVTAPAGAVLFDPNKTYNQFEVLKYEYQLSYDNGFIKPAPANKSSILLFSKSVYASLDNLTWNPAVMPKAVTELFKSGKIIAPGSFDVVLNYPGFNHRMTINVKTHAVPETLTFTGKVGEEMLFIQKPSDYAKINKTDGLYTLENLEDYAKVYVSMKLDLNTIKAAFAKYTDLKVSVTTYSANKHPNGYNKTTIGLVFDKEGTYDVVFCNKDGGFVNYSVKFIIEKAEEKPSPAQA